MQTRLTDESTQSGTCPLDTNQASNFFSMAIDIHELDPQQDRADSIKSSVPQQDYADFTKSSVPQQAPADPIKLSVPQQASADPIKLSVPQQASADPIKLSIPQQASVDSIKLSVHQQDCSNSIKSDTSFSKPADTKLIMHSLLVGLHDSEEDFETKHSLFPNNKTKKNLSQLQKKMIRESVTEHPLLKTLDAKNEEHPAVFSHLSVSQQINHLCHKRMSYSYRSRFLTRLPSDIHIDAPISLDTIAEEKEEKDQHSFRRRVQHGVFSFFTIMPTDTWKGIAGNILLWTMQTGASLWSAKNGYEGLYKWYADSSIEKTDITDVSMEIICAAASIFLFWLTQKGIGTGIHHYKLFKTVIDGLRDAVNEIVKHLQTINKTQKTLIQKINLLEKNEFFLNELVKMSIELVTEQERCNDNQKRRIVTLLQELQMSYPSNNNLEFSSSGRRMSTS